MIATILLAFAAGLLGSIPVTGPVSAGVVSLGVARRLREARALAAGAAVGEVAWAGLAFVGSDLVLEHWPNAVAGARWVAGIGTIALGAALVWRGLSAVGAGPGAAGTFTTGLLAVVLNPSIAAQ